MRLIPTVIALSMVASGCATAPPNTPGAGSGQTYTPVIDMQGVDHARYSQDLNDCRGYSRAVDSQAAGMQGAIGGAILLGVLSAALGGNGQMNSQAATAGGFAGLVGNEGRALGKQERIITNCMAMRGYRTLDGAMAMPGMQAPQAAPTTATQATTSTQTPAPPSYYTSQLQAAGPAPAPTGQDGYVAEKMAREQSCAATPRATLVAKGPGFETFSVQCSTGDALMLRCEFGNCRPLR